MQKLDTKYTEGSEGRSKKRLDFQSKNIQ